VPRHTALAFVAHIPHLSSRFIISASHPLTNFLHLIGKLHRPLHPSIYSRQTRRYRLDTTWAIISIWLYSSICSQSSNNWISDQKSVVLDPSSVRGVSVQAFLSFLPKPQLAAVPHNSTLNMGPQLFQPTLSFPTPMQQTGPSPLQILMASPQPFVPETIKRKANIGVFDEPERSAKKPRIMTLEQYKAMRAGKPYINTSPEVQEQTKDDARRKPSTLHPTLKEVQTSSSEESTPEPDVTAVPEVGLHARVPRSTIWTHKLH